MKKREVKRRPVLGLLALGVIGLGWLVWGPSPDLPATSVPDGPPVETTAAHAAPVAPAAEQSADLPTVGPQPLPPLAIAYADAVIAEHARVSDQLLGARRRRDTRAARECREALHDLAAGNRHPALSPATLQTGRAGTLADSLPLRVLQVIDDKNLLVDLPNDQTIWLAGLLTEGLADGMRLRAEGIWVVTGTQTYTTPIGGVTTVLRLETFNPTPHIHGIRERIAAGCP